MILHDDNDFGVWDDAEERLKCYPLIDLLNSKYSEYHSSEDNPVKKQSMLLVFPVEARFYSTNFALTCPRIWISIRRQLLAC